MNKTSMLENLVSLELTLSPSLPPTLSLSFHSFFVSLHAPVQQGAGVTVFDQSSESVRPAGGSSKVGCYCSLSPYKNVTILVSHLKKKYISGS